MQVSTLLACSGSPAASGRSSRFLAVPNLLLVPQRSPEHCRPARLLAGAPRATAAAGSQDRSLNADAEYKGRVQAMWTKRSGGYDTARTIHVSLCKRLVQLADLQPGAAVLDIATGTGTVALLAAPLVGLEGRVVGIDITAGMVEQARAKLQRPEHAGLGGCVEFHCGDAEAVDFPASSFDFVLCSSGIAYMHDTQAAVARFRRWLRPGGRLVFNNPRAPVVPVMEVLFALARERFGVELADISAPLGTEQRIHDVLDGAGFQDIQVTETEELQAKWDTTPEQYAEWVFDMMERFPGAPMSQQLSLEQIAQLKSEFLPLAAKTACGMQVGADIIGHSLMLWATASTPQQRLPAATGRTMAAARPAKPSSDSDAEYKARVKDMWAKRSNSYDTGRTIHASLCEQLVRLADIPPGAAVLDIATGTGTVALLAAPLTGPEGRVVGIDITPSMVEQARAKLGMPEHAGLEAHVEFQCGDAEAAEFSDGSFDFVLCSSGMAYLHDIPAGVARFRQWLRPGGRLVFNNPLAPMVPGTETLSRLARERFGAELPDVGARLGTAQRIREALGGAGFQDIQVLQTEELQAKWDTTPEQYAEWVFGMMETFPAAPMSQQLSSQQIAQLKAEFLPRATEMAYGMQEGADIINKYNMLWAIASV